MKPMPLITHLDGVNGHEALTRFADQQSGMLLCLSGFASFQMGAKHCEMHAGDMLVLGLFSNVSLTYINVSSI